jgi:hypothetical protein
MGGIVGQKRTSSTASFKKRKPRSGGKSACSSSTTSDLELIRFLAVQVV